MKIKNIVIALSLLSATNAFAYGDGLAILDNAYGNQVREARYEASEVKTLWALSYQAEAVGQYQKSLDYIGKILAKAPSNEFALMRQAWTFYLLGKFNDSVYGYKSIIERNPNSIEARQGLTLPLLAQKRYGEVSIEARKIITLSEWDYIGRIRLLAATEGLKKWEQLGAQASELSNHYPSDVASIIYLAHAEAWQGHVELAKLVYAKVLERSPDNLEANAYIKGN